VIEMQVIIPMAGGGKRFSDAGFESIKPLILVGGKPMVERAASIFPDAPDHKFIFVCRKEHLEGTCLAETLKRIRPYCRIVGIDPKGKGPVHSVLQAEEFIDDSDEALVSYCDFEVAWDYGDFLKKTRAAKADGAIPSFSGFQAAQLTGTTYAYLRTDEKMMVKEIREKKSFTENKELELASTGTYYFRNGALLKKYFRKAVEGNHSVNGEFYASLPFNPMIADGLRVVAYKVDKFICFGTPADVRLYNYWHGYFGIGKGRP
jgi:NDP-sugar pyrophosphorylase family protein